jgi:SAM-dependent methyltransferase
LSIGSQTIELASCVSCAGPLQSNPVASKSDHDYGYCRVCDLLSRTDIGEGHNLRDIYDKHYYDSWGGAEVKDSYWELKKTLFELILERGGAINSNTNALDIGCATGACLSVFEGRHFESFGVDINTDAVPIAKQACPKSHLVIGNVQDELFLPQQFGLIMAIDVIEHLRKPHELLRIIWKLLEPGGVAFVLTPNFRSISSKIFGTHWPHRKEEHVCIYSSQSLKRQCDRYKINVEMIKALPKPLNLDYMINQLQHYHSSYFIKAISWICSKVPAIFRSLIFRVPMGEVILVIRKPLQS